MSLYYEVEKGAQPCRRWAILTGSPAIFLVLDLGLCPYTCDTSPLHAFVLGGSAFTSDILQEEDTSLEVDTGLETSKAVHQVLLLFCKMPGNGFCFALSRAVRYTDVIFYPSARFYYSCLHSLNSTLKAQPCCSILSMQTTHTLKTHSQQLSL